MITEKEKLINRLSKIEGQVRGVSKMLDKDEDYLDILTQTEAINAAINSFNKEIIKLYITNDKKQKKYGTEEFIKRLQKLMK